MFFVSVVNFLFVAQFTLQFVASQSFGNEILSECIARLTLSTTTVLEGKLDSLSNLASRESSNASFTFKRSFKSKSKKISSLKTPHITVIQSTPSDLPLCSSEVVDANSLVPQQTYVIFSNQSVSVTKTSEPVAAIVVFSEARFLPVSSSLVDVVRRYSCAKCGKLKLKLVPKSLKLLLGQKLVLKCEISGKPMPVIQWLKDKQLLVTDDHMEVTLVKHVSYLRIAKVTINDAGSYQCRATNPIAVINSSVSAIYVAEAGNTEHSNVHAESCSTPDYCMNGGKCLLLKSLGRKYCRCRIGFTGFRCYHQSSTNVTTNQYVPVEANETFMISGIAIATLIVAGVAITVFFIVRKWWVSKHHRPRSMVSVYRPPSLPDGHIFNVNQLHAAITQQAAIEFANVGRNSLVLSSFDSAADASRRGLACEMPILRRENRSNSSIVPPSNADGLQRLSSFQVQLQRLSMHSSQQLQPPAARQRLPVISATPDCDQQEQSMFEMVNRSSENDLDSSRCEQAAIETVERSQGRTQDSVDPTTAVEEAMLSPRSSQCSHTESLMCSGQAFGDEDNLCGNSRLQPAPAASPPWYAAACKAYAGSDISEDFDDERNAVDLEVNFESEADILGVETSGDELERVGTGRDFSEMSSQMTERGISDEEDGNCSSASDVDGIVEDDGMFGANRLLLGYMRSGSDLSWDESADLPSFAINGNLLQFNRT